MIEEIMMRRLYGLYQLDWMMSHGYSLADLMRGMTNIPWYHDGDIYDYYENEEDTEPAGMRADVEGIFKSWEFDSDAFGGSCWACFNEFCGAELTMPDYIQGLMNAAHDDELAEAYKKWLKDNESEETI